MSRPVQSLLDLRRIFTLLAVLSVLYVSTKIFRVIQRTYRSRQRYQEIPQLPRHPVWGHLVNMGEKLNPALKRHPDYAFEEIWNSLGKPPAYLMDLHPVDSSFLVVADHRIAEEISQPSPTFKYSLPRVIR